MSQCSYAQLVVQSVDLRCTAQSERYRNVENRPGSSCKLCLDGVELWREQRRQLDEDALAKNSQYDLPTPSADVVKSFENLSTRGPCQYVCQQCIFRDISQLLNFRISTECITNDNFSIAFVRGMTAQASNEVLKHQASTITILSFRNIRATKKVNLYKLLVFLFSPSFSFSHFFSSSFYLFLIFATSPLSKQNSCNGRYLQNTSRDGWAGPKRI